MSWIWLVQIARLQPDAACSQAMETRGLYL